MVYAAGNPNPEVIDYLMNAGLSLEEETKENLSRILLIAVKKNPNAGFVRKLIKIGADIEAKDEKGATPLMLAAQFNPSAEMMSVLLDLGASPRAKDKNGRIAFDYAMEGKHLKSEAYWELQEASQRK